MPYLGRFMQQLTGDHFHAEPCQRVEIHLHRFHLMFGVFLPQHRLDRVDVDNRVVEEAAAAREQRAADGWREKGGD